MIRAFEKNTAVIRSPARVLRLFAALAVGIAAIGPAAADNLREAAESGAYSAAGLYDPEILSYDNGLTLILKRRAGVRTVSIRVRVGLGMAHYECGQRHVPHFLEHMLYDSIPGMSEQALERRFFELGASSNALTQSTETIYQLDIFGGTVMEGRELTADMLTRAELSEQSFGKTRRVIFREEGGTPGDVETQTLAGGRLASGARNVLADVAPRHFGACGIWDTGEEVELSQIQRAYDIHYVPERMVWVIVGDFDQDAVLQWADKRLATLPAAGSPLPREPGPGKFQQREYAGFSDEPGVALMAFTGGVTGEDYFSVSLIEHVLDTRLYQRLRLDTALTYTPNASLHSEADWGIFMIAADIPSDDQEAALAVIKDLIGELAGSPMPDAAFRAAQLSLLRQWAQSIETNAGYADYYTGSFAAYRRDGAFVNDEARLAALTPEAVQQAAARLFAPDNVVYVRDDDRQAEIKAD